MCLIVCVYVCVSVCVCVYVCACMCVYLCVFVCVYVYIYIYIYIYIFVFVCVSVSVCLCVHVQPCNLSLDIIVLCLKLYYLNQTLANVVISSVVIYSSFHQSILFTFLHCLVIFIAPCNKASPYVSIYFFRLPFFVEHKFIFNIIKIFSPILHNLDKSKTHPHASECVAQSCASLPSYESSPNVSNSYYLLSMKLLHKVIQIVLHLYKSLP